MMRSVKHRGDAKADTEEESSSFLDNDDDKKATGVQFLKPRFGGVVCFLGLFAVVISHSGQSSNATTSSTMVSSGGKTPHPMRDYPDLSKVFSKYDSCVVKWKPPPPKDEFDTKPIWMPAFPGSGTTGPVSHGDIMKPLINAMTGLAFGAKFYHASAKDLKRCQGRSETVTCAQGHPMVDVAPEKQTSNFYHSVLLVIRNFRTVFPVHHNDKAEAYHDAKEQVSIQEWRQARDGWYLQGFEGWKSIVTTWKKMPEYEIGEIIQYEELFDPDRGPAAVERLAKFLASAGFAVAPKDDLHCIWFTVIKKEYMRLQEYNQYHYGYTKEQRDRLLKEMETLQALVADDPRLVKILNEYYEDIRDNTYVDVPYQGRR